MSYRDVFMKVWSTQKLTLKSLNVEHITAEEKTMLENIQHDSDNHRDTIVDHGYTGDRNHSFFTR